ncbi:MAG TPA: ABC transporter permease [Ruminococcaceae bacterium]|jgi:simple sugar transport system permease protein|nr:ABC transporter permease [Oscillospiraceae bacterium]
MLALFGIALGIIAIMAFADPAFLKGSNFRSMAFQFPEFGILSFGMMLCMISGGIDLSLVGAANLSGIVAAVVILSTGGSIAVGIAAALLVGAVCGLFNGYLIGQLQIPAMLVTLCGGQLFTGLGMAITKGPAITGLPEQILVLSNGTVGGVLPYALLLFILIALALGFLLKSTVYGQHLCLMGSNPTASRYSGINNLHVTLLTYMTSGILAAVSGILILSHYGSAKSDYGMSYTLLSLLIVVLGGVAPAGGRGRVSCVALSAVILQLISSAFNVLRFNSFVKTFVWGLLLVIVMVAQSVIQKEAYQFLNIRRKNYEKDHQQA